MRGTVILVGAGPGDPGLLTLRAADALRDAEVLLYDALASDAIIAMANETCERIFVGKRGGDHAMAQDAIEALMVRKARDGKRVVRLKGGDPLVFGRGGEEAQTLHAAGIAFEIVPGISSSIAAPAYAGIPVTHRDHNAAFTVATGHEDPTKPESTIDWQRLADPHRTLVLLMAMGNLSGICERLRANGLSASTPVAVIQDGTRPTQRTVVGTLETIADRVLETGLEAPAIVVVGNVVGLRDELRWFDRRPLFGKRVLITRAAAQSMSFARAVHARGAEAVIAPTIRIALPDDPQPAERAIDELASYRWIVFTSENGVDAFFARLAARGADARALGSVKIAVTGSRTGERLQTYGVHADLTPERFIGEAVARALIDVTAPGERVLLFRAQEGRDVLPQMLGEAGRDVTVVAAYRTAVADDAAFAVNVSRADIITFTSDSTVRGFCAMLGGNAAAVEATRERIIACIGPVTAEAATHAGLRVDVVADVFTTDGILDALETYLALPA